MVTYYYIPQSIRSRSFKVPNICIWWILERADHSILAQIRGSLHLNWVTTCWSLISCHFNCPMPLLDIFQDRSIHHPALHPLQFSFQRLLVSRCHRLVHGPLPHLGLEFRSANGPIDEPQSHRVLQVPKMPNMRKLCVADGQIAICLLSQSSKRGVSLSPSIQMYAFTSSNVLLFQPMPPRHSWRTSEFPTPAAGEGLSFFCQTANSSSIFFRIWTYLLSNLSLLDS